MIRAILFDLDGTLLDTAPDLIDALNCVRSAEGLPGLDEAQFRHHVSKGAVGLVKAGFPDAPQELQASRKEQLLNHYRQNVFVQTRPFDGVMDLLETLDSRAVPWGVVTNKPEYLTYPILDHAGLLNRSACVVCGDTIPQSKPHPAPVLLACEIVKVPAQNCLMVGDDVRDLEAGRRAGTATALAEYGYLSPDALEADYAGSLRIAKPADLLGILDRANHPLERSD